MAAISVEASSLFQVNGIVAVVTGGGTGIGLMIAQALATNGARKVYILGRRLETLRAAASSHPNILTPLQCDITSKPSLQAAVDAVTAEVGYINLLVANSGIYGPAATYDTSASVSDLRKRMFDGVSMENFTQAFHVNVTGAFFTMLAFLELLDEGNRRAVSSGTYGAPLVAGGKVPAVQSQVVVTASVSSFMRGPFTSPAYGGSKAAVVHMVKHAASVLAPYGIRANALVPGFFPSEMADSMIAHRKPEEEPFEDVNFIPARKFGSEREMGGTILYLASQAGSFCNGLILPVDGGRLAVTMSSY